MDRIQKTGGCTRRRMLKGLGVTAGGILLAGLLPGVGCRPGGMKFEKLLVQAPPSPPSIALAKMVADDAFASYAGSSEFALWKNPDEMRGRITARQAHISGLPINVAATLYNRGLKIQLTSVYIWGILYLVSTDQALRSWEELAGQEVLIPFKGDLPDILTQLLLLHRGMLLGQEISVRYVAAAPEAAGLLAAGQAQHAVLSEPSATLAIMQAQAAGIPLVRAIDLQADWAMATGRRPRMPMAGVAILPEVAQDHPELVKHLQVRQAEAVDWVRNNPALAAQLGKDYIPTMPEPAMADSLEHINLEFVSAEQAREEIEFFFDQLAQLTPALYGEQLPDDHFYYSGK